MKNQIIIKTLSCIINLLSGLFVAIIILYFQDWFGSNDTYSFMFFTVPLAVEIAFFGKSILNLFAVKNKLLKLLIIFSVAVAISFVWVYCVYLILGPWIKAFSIPVFPLWTIGVFFQLVFIDRFVQTQRTKSTIKRVLRVVLGIPSILILSVICTYGLSSLTSYLTRPKPETFIIPSNFQGNFKVIYGQECGIIPPTENGRRILRIPADGVLIVQPKYKKGVTDYNFYFVDEDGVKTKIKEIYSDGSNNISGVQFVGTTSVGGGMSYEGYTLEPSIAIRCADFRVTHNTPDNNTVIEKRKFKSLSKLVDECRALKK